MTGEQQLRQCRFAKVNSEVTWDMFLSQARNHGCPVVVHFSASWYMPSVAMKPIFEELALTYQKILFLVVDVDEIKGVASKMEIKAMPTFLMIRGGVVVDKLIGANPDEIKKRVEGLLN